MSGARYASSHPAAARSAPSTAEGSRSGLISGELPRIDALPTPESIPGTLLDVLRLRAERDPSGVALADPLGTETTAQLLSLSRRVGEVLQAHGVRADDRVACVSRSSAAGVRWIVGIGCHAAVVPIDPALGEAAAQALMRRVGVTLLVVDGPQTEAARAAARSLAIPVLDVSMAQLAEVSRRAENADRCASLRPEHTPDASAPQPDSIFLVLSSSGTTGRPKLVPHTQHAMLWRCGQHQHPDQVMDFRGWVNPMPLYHAFGIYCLLKSLLWGTVYCALDGFAADDFAGWVRRIDADVYGATPLIHAELLRTMEQDPALLAGWRPRTVFSSGAPLSAVGLHALLERFDAPVQVNYGMTECALTVQVYRPGQPVDSSVGRATPGVVQVVDPSGRALPIGEVGEVVTRGPTVLKGYLDDPALTARSFRDGWFLTGDLGRLAHDGTLSLVGRSSLLINRGGAKVSPAEIEDWLVSQPGVRLAVALGVPHAALGEDLVAAVVPHAGERLDGDALRQAMLAELPGYKVPSRVLAVESLPLGPAGKVRREGLVDDLRGALGAPHRAAATPLEHRALDCLARALQVDARSISVDANFFELGGHSLLAARMIAALQAETGQPIALGRFMGEPTAEGLARLMADMKSQPAHPDIEVFREGSGEGSRAPLFCLPGYVGHAHFARLVLPYLSPSVPVLGVLAPGCEPDEASPIERIATACVERIRETQPLGPYRLLGYSLGGVVAHEVACQLQAQGERVESLVLLDSRAGLDVWADPSTSAGNVLQRAVPRHCPGVFDGQVILFRSWSGPLSTLGAPGLGWEHLARQGVALFDVPTTHFGLVQPLAMASWGPVLGRLLDAHAGTGMSDRTATSAAHPDVLVPWQPVPQLLRARRAALDARWGRVLVCLLDVARTRAVVPVWAAEWVLRVAQSARPWRLWQPISRGLVRRWMAGRVEWALSAGRVRDTRCAPANPGRGDQDLSALARYQRPETVLLAEAVLHRVQGDGGAAAACMNRLDQLIGDRDDLRVALVQQLEAIGWTERAEQEASRVRGDAPVATVAQMCGERCLQAQRRGDGLSAVREGRRAIDLLPTVPHWYCMLIEALVSTGDREAALELREQALERFPAQWGYRAELDRALGVSG